MFRDRNCNVFLLRDVTYSESCPAHIQLRFALGALSAGRSFRQVFPLCITGRLIHHMRSGPVDGSSFFTAQSFLPF